MGSTSEVCAYHGCLTQTICRMFGGRVVVHSIWLFLFVPHCLCEHSQTHSYYSTLRLDIDSHILWNGCVWYWCLLAIFPYSHSLPQIPTSLHRQWNTTPISENWLINYALYSLSKEVWRAWQGDKGCAETGRYSIHTEERWVYIFLWYIVSFIPLTSQSINQSISIMAYLLYRRSPLYTVKN